MITKEVKARAIALLNQDFAAEDVAERLGVPTAIVQEWYDSRGDNDIITLEANNIALQTVFSAPIGPNQIEALHNKMLKAAVKIAEETYKAASTGDLAYAKSIEYCANTLETLHRTFLLKTEAEAPGTVSFFDSLEKLD